MKKKSKSTIIDVAQAANVSRQTVSRVLRDPSIVADNTRKRVIKVIEKLGYHPDPVAQSLVTKRTYLIGILISGFTGYTRDRILAGAQSEARKHRFNLFICEADAGKLGEPEHSPLLNTQRYEGVFVLYRGAKTDNFRILADIHDDVPMVTLGYRPNRDLVTRITTQDRKGSYLATRHLLDLGHRRIGVIAGMEGRFDVKDRVAGYRKAVRETGLELNPDLIEYADWTLEGANDAMGRLLSREKITAVVVQSDLMAFGCLSALYERDILVPRDMSIVGFDNIDIGRYIIPPLTTVDNMIFETGRRAIQILTEAIGGKKPSADVLKLPTKLIVRGSTASPSGRLIDG
jgi:LacI family transcriptional regulator